MAEEDTQEKETENTEVDEQNDQSVGGPPLTDSQIFKLIELQAQRIANVRDRPVLYILYPYISSVDSPHAMTVYNLFREYKEEIGGLDVIVHSRGGDIHEAYDITKLCKRYASEDVNLFVPLEAMSATTLLALGVDKVLLSEIGKVGPLDPQIPHPESGRYMPVQSITDVPRVLENALNTHTTEIDPEVKGEFIIEPIAEQVDPYYLAENDEKSELAKQYGQRLLKRRDVDKEPANRCLDCLVSEYPAHAYSIDFYEIDNNPALNEVINAERVKDLDQGEKIERLLIDLTELFLYWDYKYLEKGEPQRDVKIDLISPGDPGEQVELDDMVAMETPEIEEDEDSDLEEDSD